MSSENGFMAIVRKNPVTTGIVTFAVLSILIIVIVMMMKKNNTPKPPTTKEGFSFSDTFSLSNMTDEDADHIGLGGGYEENGYDYENEEIVENFPQPSPQNVMYSDANGNLATTTDLGVEYISVTRDSAVSGNSTVSGNLAVKGDSNLKGNVLSRDVFGGGSQLKTETIVAGNGYGGRLHLLGDNVYMMAKNGVRIATDPNSNNPWGGANGNLTVDGRIGTPLLGRYDGDWLRINDGESVGRTAIYGKVSINDTKNGHGGLSVGEWDAPVGAGNIKATGNISAGSIGTGSVNIYNYGDVRTKLDELFTKVATLEGKMNNIKTVQVFNRVRGGNGSDPHRTPVGGDGIWNGIKSDQFTVGTGTKLFHVNFSLYCGGHCGTRVTFTFSNGHICIVDGYINAGGNHQGQSASFVIPNSKLPEGPYTCTCTLNGGAFDGNDYCFATITTLPN